MTTTKGSGAQPTNQVQDWLLNYSPQILDLIRNNQDFPLFAALIKLCGFVFGEGGLELPAMPDDLDMAAQSVRKLDPIYAPQAYLDAIGDISKPPAEKITVRYEGSNEDVVLTLAETKVDDQTGFRGATYKDASGHSVVFYGGTDVSHGVDMKDIAAIAQSALNQHVNHQTGPAQEMAINAMRGGTAEVVGYSLGAGLGEHMASLGMKVTTFGDVGLPDVKNEKGERLYTDDHLARANENIISLKMPGDMCFEKFGKVHGTVITLPGVAGQDVLNGMQAASLPANFNAQSGMANHHPVAYALGAQKQIDLTESSITASTAQPLARPVALGSAGT